MAKKSLIMALLALGSIYKELNDLSASDRYAVAYKPKRKKFKRKHGKR